MVVETVWDCVIVGAGAAGLMTAITAARGGAKVLVLDGKEKIGAKILMSGGTRCNVTNRLVSEKDYEGENKHAIRNVLRAFPSDQAVEFFRELGVRLELEPGGKYFPATHSAKTVLHALTKEIDRLGVTLYPHHKVNCVAFDGACFHISGKNFLCAAKTLVLTTGGLSHPTTGSDGSGYQLAHSLGHDLIRTTPALTPLVTTDAGWKQLAGITLENVRLTLWVNQKKGISFAGGFLFTHFGFSGPAALNISRHWIHWKNQGADVTLAVNFLPDQTEESIRKYITGSKKTAKNFLSDLFPDRLAAMLVKKNKISESETLSQLKREERELLIRSLFHFPLVVARLYGYEKAEATAGGVDLSEVDTRTMESRIQPRLFFAGEILDADGVIGGFNFQWAWASGYLAGRAVAEKKQ
ncbi:MAG: NAD(P)/FAD-dependent oxidoreductase [Candidatus Omnitrophica bacterium]|nr:NAD(P)/FAD-dependent oxidoreductase [Candidatus Omnitrophota bacterium]